MTLHLTIERKLMALGLLGLAFVLALGGTGYDAASRLAASATRLSVGGSALKNQLQADMAHDALRADVLAALLAGAKASADEQKAIRADLDEHAAGFRDSLKKLHELPLDAPTREAVTRVQPSLAAYVDSAASVVARPYIKVGNLYAWQGQPPNKCSEKLLPKLGTCQ